jgi:hypothetical protein
VAARLRAGFTRSGAAAGAAEAFAAAAALSLDEPGGAAAAGDGGDGDLVDPDAFLRDAEALLAQSRGQLEELRAALDRRQRPPLPLEAAALAPAREAARRRERALRDLERVIAIAREVAAPAAAAAGGEGSGELSGESDGGGLMMTGARGPQAKGKGRI